MKSILAAMLKALGTRRALEVILDVLRWITDKTENKWDDEIYDYLCRIYNLLYPVIPEKRRK
jgi:hypothetical protein